MVCPRLRGVLGAALAAGVLAGVLAVPAPLADGPRAIAPSDVPLASREPAPTGLAARFAARLSTRMPALEQPELFRLARTIVAEAETARIDPLLVLALIEVESGYDPAALSGRGARGLMQLREPTMRREAQRSGLTYDDPHDPVSNVQAGVRYLRRLLDAFGHEDVALMAYNAGPNRILGYLREGEIPERFHAYPRRVGAELRKLRRHFGPQQPQAYAVAETAARPSVD